MSGRADLAHAEDWIRAHVEPMGPIETAHDRPWATVLRVPVADGVAWFKACAPVQAFEPRLTAELSARYPDRVAEVLGYDEERRRLAERPEPVPEADALEQTEEVEPDDDDEAPTIPPDVPEADALDQARTAPRDDDEPR